MEMLRRSLGSSAFPGRAWERESRRLSVVCVAFAGTVDLDCGPFRIDGMMSAFLTERAESHMRATSWTASLSWSTSIKCLAMCCAFGLMLAVSQIAAAQSTPSDGAGGANGGLSAGDGESSPAAMPGGAVIADFDTLMNLIQQTIDPDSWLQAGGTNTISPYPAGVYVDPKGYMKRLKESGSCR